MRLRGTRRRTAASMLALVTAGALSLAGCGSSSDNTSDSAGGGASASAGPCGTTKPTTLTVGLYGTFGFKENGLWDAYKKVCPNITIKEDDVEQSADYWTKLKTRLASGSGLDDVQGIEIGFVGDVLANHADQFVNWQTVPNAAADKAEFYPWKWNMATTADGKDTVGLGTDTGPQSICYRADLFKQAGLPTDTATLTKDFSTWDGLLNLGKQYEASKTKPEGSSFIDSVNSIFNAAVYQGTEAYDDDSGQPDVANSDGVKNAWKIATEAAQDKISAGLAQWGPDWNKAFSSGTFAALACPTWMMGYIQGQAGDAGSGKWAVSPVMPGGASNWGGSWLGVPKASKNQPAAIALVEWLSNKGNQVTMWTSPSQGGHWPSNSQAAADPSVSGATSTYFSGDPIGQIYSKIANQMKIPPIGQYDTQIQSDINTQLTNVETKGTSPSSAWSAALNAIKQVTG